MNVLYFIMDSRKQTQKDSLFWSMETNENTINTVVHYYI